MKQFNKIKAIKIFLFAFLLFAAGTTNAQVGIGTPNPNASAQLDVNSTSKGFLPPRMTQTQRDAITNPVAGLTIWCKDCGVLGEIQVSNGAGWMNMTGGYPASPLPLFITTYSQIWMTKNLDVVTYRNGDTIPQVTDNTWRDLTTGAWCYLNNDPANGPIFGKIYNWYAVNDPRGLAPAGWHIPSVKEWETLIDYLGGHLAAGFNMRASTLWMLLSGAKAATNESGFSGLPGGFRSGNITYFGPFGLSTRWWASGQEVGFQLNAYSGNATNGDIWITDMPKNYGAYVRCVKD